MPTRELDWLDRIFLAGANVAEKAGLYGTEGKLYNDVVQRGRREPITEADLSADDMAGLRRAISAKIEKTGESAGHIDYGDLRGSGVSPSLFGGFDYSGNPSGGYSVTDKYDFNTNRRDPSDDLLWKRLLMSAFAPGQMAASIGRKVAPPGYGVPVRVNVARTSD